MRYIEDLSVSSVLGLKTANFHIHNKNEFIARVLRGLNLFVVWALSGASVQVMIQSHALFRKSNGLGTSVIKFEMNISEKTRKYIGLVVPLTCCPIGEPVKECPFIQFWKDKDWDERVKPIEELPEEELDRLQDFHHKCLMKKVELARENPDNEKLSKINLADHFLY